MLSVVFKSCWNICDAKYIYTYVSDTYAHAYVKLIGVWIPCDRKYKGQKPTNGKQKGKYILIMPSLPFGKKKSLDIGILFD